MTSGIKNPTQNGTQFNPIPAIDGWSVHEYVCTFDKVDPGCDKAESCLLQKANTPCIGLWTEWGDTKTA
jgi:hypothetical protein